jgi:hypothetical protein
VYSKRTILNILKDRPQARTNGTKRDVDAKTVSSSRLITRITMQVFYWTRTQRETKPMRLQSNLCSNRPLDWMLSVKKMRTEKEQDSMPS